MNKTILTILFYIVATSLFGQKVVFNIKYSKQLSVFVFLQNLSKNAPDNVFKVEFNKSAYNIEKYQNIISKFDKLSLDYSYQFEEFPYGSKIPMQARDVLKKKLIETNNLTEFKLRSIGIVPNKTLNDLTECISEFIPIYNELIYTPNKEKFEYQIEEITKYATKHNIQNYFETGLLFYNSIWDISIPFEIALYPLPNSQGFTADAFLNNFISGIQTNLKDNKDLFSVMLHEIFHIIYNEQSLEVKTEIYKNFKENRSKSSNYAYQLFNEVLATALGNGYVFEKLDGKLDAGDWYNRKYVNLMAKQIYPLVKEYALQKKPIDRKFIDNYIKLYDDNFPNWINELDNIMTYRYVISESEKDFEAINKLFPYCSSAEYDTEVSANSIIEMQKTPLTKVIIISKNNAEKLKLVKNKYNELKDWKFDFKNEFVFKVFLDDKSQLIIINKKSIEIDILLKNLQSEDK